MSEAQDDDVPQRARRARSSLSVDAILAAAETVAARGFDALTIRAVAGELEAAPMALYRHFATKEELVDALLDRVLGRFDAPPQTSDWTVDLRNFALAHRRLLSEHPWAIVPLTRNPNPGPNALPIGEAALEILHRAGIEGDEAVATFSGLIALNYGWASFVDGRARAEVGRTAVRPIPAASVASFPRTAAVGEAMNRYGSDRHYESVLGQLLHGIDAGRDPSPT